MADVPLSRAEEQKYFSVLTTASKSFLLAAGLHLGVGTLAGVTSQKLFKRSVVWLLLVIGFHFLYKDFAVSKRTVQYGRREICIFGRSECLHLQSLENSAA